MVAVELPDLLQLAWCESGLSALPACADTGAPDVVRFAAHRPIRYVDPAALALLGSWGSRWIAQGRSVEVDDSLKGPYSWRIGLLTALAGKFGSSGTHTNNAILFKVDTDGQIGATLDELVRLLGVTRLDVELAKAVQYFVSEILRNVFEHSQSEAGAFLAAGYFPKVQKLTLAVADSGVTVPKHVQRRWKEKVSDRSALEVALEPRVSGSTDGDRNAGLGLYMTRRIVTLMGGAFWILTGTQGVRSQAFMGPGTPGNLEFFEPRRPWEGTCVVFSLYTGRTHSFTADQRFVQQELGGHYFDSLDLCRKNPVDGIELFAVPRTAANLAEDKGKADSLRKEHIGPHLKMGIPLQLDFGGVQIATQSFVHALIAEPLRRFGPERFKGLVHFVRVSSQVRQVLRIVVQHVRMELDAGGETSGSDPLGS